MQNNPDVTLKPGLQIFVADHLSRTSLKDTSPDKVEFQEFALELEAMNPFDTIKISSERMPQPKDYQARFCHADTVETTILMGWPEHRDEVPVHMANNTGI